MPPDARLEQQLVAALRRALAGARPQVPEAGALVWQWFVDLCGTRAVGAAGPRPIAYAEVEAYARLTGWPIEPRHVGLLRALDAEWMKHALGNLTSRDRPTAPRSSGQALTPAAFDAVFG
jgi:hypothetical protein